MRRSRASTLLGLTIGLALVLVALLGIGALTTSRYLRAQTDAVLGDFATFAGDQLVARLESRLAVGSFPILVLIRNRLQSGSRLELLDPETIRRTAPTSSFGRLVVNTFVSRPGDSIEAAGPTLSARDRDAVISAQAIDPLSLDSSAYFAIKWPHPDGPVVIYDRLKDRSGRSTNIGYGFTVPLAQVPSVVALAIGNQSLLPRNLAERVPADSVLGIAVTPADGGSPVTSIGFDATSPYLASRLLRPQLGLEVSVSLAKSTAARLLPFAAPTGQGTAYAVLLAGAVGLLLLAWFLFGQERQLAQLREDFLTSVSHELRTPLAQIRLFADTLSLGRIRTEAERDRSLAIISQETARLSHLVDNLLYFNRSERGRLVPDLRSADLGGYIGQVVSDFSPLAEAARSRVVTDLEPVTTRFDHGQIRQVLLNLLDNAIKYGPPNQVVRVTATRRGGSVELAVEDQGPGIAAEHRHRVWERFWRSPVARDRGAPGAGIGLAVVAELVELHGGAARVEDGPGGGARFVVSLPLAPDGGRP
jgi:signal transduction histidine kinase